MKFLRVWIENVSRSGIVRGADSLRVDPDPKPNESVWWNPSCNYLVMKKLDNNGKQDIEVLGLPQLMDWKIHMFSEKHNEVTDESQILGVDLSELNMKKKRVKKS